jgi:hypothetical protein
VVLAKDKTNQYEAPEYDTYILDSHLTLLRSMSLPSRTHFAFPESEA